MITKRICLVPKDVAILTGRSEGYARRLVRSIKRNIGKSRADLLTVEEFCHFTRMNSEEVSRAINRL